jgi:hypothetical protein
MLRCDTDDPALERQEAQMSASIPTIYLADVTRDHDLLEDELCTRTVNTSGATHPENSRQRLKKKAIEPGPFMGRAIAVRRAALERKSNLIGPVTTARATSVKDSNDFPTKPVIHF